MKAPLITEVGTGTGGRGRYWQGGTEELKHQGVWEGRTIRSELKEFSKEMVEKRSEQLVFILNSTLNQST